MGFDPEVHLGVPAQPELVTQCVSEFALLPVRHLLTGRRRVSGWHQARALLFFGLAWHRQMSRVEISDYCNRPRQTVGMSINHLREYLYTDQLIQFGYVTATRLQAVAFTYAWLRDRRIKRVYEGPDGRKGATSLSKMLPDSGIWMPDHQLEHFQKILRVHSVANMVGIGHKLEAPWADEADAAPV